MTTASLREQLIARIDRMTDDEIRELIEQIDMVQYKSVMQSDELPPDYNEEEDIAIGLISSKTGDLAMRAKEILREEITRFGWTQKED